MALTKGLWEQLPLKYIPSSTSFRVHTQIHSRHTETHRTLWVSFSINIDCVLITAHDGKPYCHKPCYAALFGPKGVNIGGAGSYVYEAPANPSPPASNVDSAPKPQENRVPAFSRPPSKAGSITTFSGEANLCPRCNKKVYFAEKVTSLGKDWHRPCLRCERCRKTLAAGSHAEHNGQPYCHKPCYAVLFGPKGVNTGGVGSYIYDKELNTEAQP
uniref:Cysteine-rich protein 2 n=1 Tax=Cyprinus carpio carpio TaxID=630221 RepID=A0A8C1FFE2_CYPCA